MNGFEIDDTHLPRLVAQHRGARQVEGVEPISGSHPTGYYDPPHLHDRAQFAFRTRGFALVRAGARSIPLPPGFGVWIPAGVVHEVACRGPAAYCGLYVAPEVEPQPDSLRVIRASPMLRALMERSLDLCNDQDPRLPLMLRLILEEISRSPDASPDTPTMPQDPRLRRVCERLRDAPEHDESVDVWASRAGMSRRSFTRTFREQTGMSFAEWRHKVRVLRAITWREEGLAMHEIANRLGYASMSSFNRAFGPAAHLIRHDGPISEEPPSR